LAHGLQTLAPRLRFVPQDRCDVLALSENSDDVQMVLAFEVKKNDGESGDGPGTQTGNADVSADPW